MAAQSSPPVTFDPPIRIRKPSLSAPVEATPPLHKLKLALALGADCHLRTSTKALAEGVANIRGAALRARLLAEAKRLGITLPLSESR